MNYQITCTCGHSFQRTGEELKGPVSCPACARPLSVVIQTPTVASPVAGSATATPDMVSTPTEGMVPAMTTELPAATAPSAPSEPTKRCPFCGEIILAIARKCKHCGEFLDRTEPVKTTTGGTSAGTATTTPSADEPIFSLTTSQWDNFWRFLILFTVVLVNSVIFIFFLPLRPYAPLVILGTLVMAGFVGWFFYLYSRNTRTYIRPTRIDVERGILSRKLDSLELFRISDTVLEQGVAGRILGIGTIKLMTTDSAGKPELVLYQIPRPREVLKYLQGQIPIAARQRGAVYME